MKILAIDTSLSAGSVAAIDAAGATEVALGDSGEHARALAGALLEAARRRGWTGAPASLAALGPDDLIAVVRGPGSFTGLRVGVTTAKALAWATGANLVGVSGFEVVARRACRLTGLGPGSLWVAFDAGRGETFAAEVTLGAGRDDIQVGPATLVAAAAWVAGLPPAAVVTGPAIAGLRETLAARPDLRRLAPEADLPTALDAGLAARARAARGSFDDPAALVPDYLRPSYAEESGTAADFGSPPGSRPPAA